MFFIDTPGKPWRGRLTGDPEAIREFFNKPDGYKNFVLHYANLVRGKVDAFVIGSELIGLTKIRSGNHFPAVHELIDLACKAKRILGSEVLVTYAADWSEYHHTEGGWYNLDDLWACEAIDFIGIDAYFPITNSKNSNISAEEIKAGWTSGEGWDHYRDANGETHPLGSEWAWKNMRWWWSNQHINPNGAQSAWIPQSKKIWLTEFGFPSIDKATNQPNIFFDPLCVDGGAPRYSTGEVDLSIQRKAIKASLEVLSEFEFLEQKFLWTWDARPYPAWPHSNAWRDARLWSHGHWVNNKLGAASLGSILLRLCSKAGINAELIDITTVDEMVGGLVLKDNGSVLDAVNMLRIGYFFDIVSSGEGLKFVKRGSDAVMDLTASDFIKGKEGYMLLYKIPEVEILQSVSLRFFDPKNYVEKSSYYKVEKASNKPLELVSLPIVMSESECKYLAVRLIESAQSERNYFKFSLPIQYIALEPTDKVRFYFSGQEHMLRVTDMRIKGLIIEVEGVSV